MGDEEHDPSVTILCNGKDEGSKRLELGTEHAGEVWTDAMGWRQGEVTIGEGEHCAVAGHDPVQSLSAYHCRSDSKEQERLTMQMAGLSSSVLPRA
jgi:hypothetical protein